MVSIVRVTIKTSTRNYVSVDVQGNGKTDFDYDVASVFSQLQSANFPSFNGTEVEWQAILANSEEVEVVNLSTPAPANPSGK